MFEEEKFNVRKIQVKSFSKPKWGMTGYSVQYCLIF